MAVKALSFKNLGRPYLDRSVSVAPASLIDAYLGPEMHGGLEAWRPGGSREGDARSHEQAKSNQATSICRDNGLWENDRPSQLLI